MDPPLPPDSLGTHTLLDLYGCSPELLDDPTGLETLLRRAAEEAGARVVGALSHRFTPHGASVVCLLAESHISIHTWPEQQTAAVDIYTCGTQCDSSRACDLIRTTLRAVRSHLQTLRRGAPPA